MGGRGSGRHPSYGLAVAKCHEYHRIDAACLVRNEFLRIGHWRTLKWSCHDRETGSVRVEAHPGIIRLVYRIRERSGDWQDIRDDVLLVETATNFGGRRKWFICPSCRRRCRILYGGKYFRCRCCHNLKYESQYDNAISRALDKRHALRKRLGYEGSLDDPFPTKPKHMHWKTYVALKRKDEQLERAWDEGISEWLQKMDPSLC